MEFSLLHAGLAAGAALAALPVILHLFHRQSPKKIIFPALRLIRERTHKTTKRLKIKNWLLLLARMLLIAIMALALARPTLHSQALLVDSEVPTAMAMVFDTSLSMGYEEVGKNRLDIAKEAAKTLLNKADAASRIFVIDSAEPASPPGLSPSAALSRIDELKLKPASRLLNDTLPAAFAAVSDTDKPRKEVFVFTDLARSAWDPGRALGDKEKTLQQDGQIALYLIRLNPEKPSDVSVVEAEAATELIPSGSPVPIKAKVRNQGPATSRVVELIVNGSKRDQKTIELPANGEATLVFLSPKLEIGIHQGEIKLGSGDDPLDFDDSRYFTFRARKPMKVLIVSDLEIDAEFIASALDPVRRSPETPRTFEAARRLSSRGLLPGDEELRAYAAVFLNNVANVTEGEWAILASHVRQGGGLVVGLGQRCRLADYQSAAASGLLPATPDQPRSPNRGTFFGKIDESHPLFDPQWAKALSADLAGIPVSRYMTVKPGPGATTLISYQDNAPALLERGFESPGASRSMLWTSPLSRRPDPQDRDAWSEFPNPLAGWSFLYLMERTIPYLAGVSAQRWTHDAGQTVMVPIDPAMRRVGYQVIGPDNKTVNQLNPPSAGNVMPVIGAQTPGHWTLAPVGAPNAGSGADDGLERLGFSINAPARESELAVIAPTDLEGLIGKDRFAIAQGPEDLERAKSEKRIGRELFPWLMILILALITAESFLANTFYRQANDGSGSGSARGASPSGSPSPSSSSATTAAA